MEDFKNIHLGEFIKKRIEESAMDIDRITAFMNNTEGEIKEMLSSPSLDTVILLRWSKLLRYDFFRLYSQHILLYAPAGARETGRETESRKGSMPRFRKNIYTPEIIQFILELIETGEKTKIEIIENYRIPKTTLYKWITKYRKKQKENMAMDTINNSSK
ncbi:recombinase family protein [Chryseobacterium sp. KMC2]|uniref:recombinase family protein n=1 Tax=Chryseobacterium sp. KMC2 TaxID=2800705 RepID=UPI0019239877|nr:recombinase family protein [Chryseobacterium sp. KMC2]MBL3548859.1 recombinase family protein [Chryseobacterium sp. KMC2]